MLRPLARPHTRHVVLSTGFAVLVAFTGTFLVLRVVLYATHGCPPNYCSPTEIALPLVPLALGVLFGLLSARSDGEPLLRPAIRGASLGLGAMLFVALVAAAAIPFHDPYFAFPYRAYALAYAAFVTASLVAWSWHALRSTSSNEVSTYTGLPLLCVVAAAFLGSVLRNEMLVSAAIAFGVVAGMLVAEAAVRRPQWQRYRRDRLALYGIVVVAFLGRAFFGIQTLLRTGPGMAFAVASDDGDSYFTLASTFVADPRAIGEVLAAVAYPPGYSLFVGTILLLTGGSMAVVILAQALLAAAATVLLYVVAAPLAGRPMALLAAALYAINQNLIQNQSTLTAEALLLPLTLVALWALTRYRATGRMRWLVAGAAALGSAFVTRNLVAIPLGVAALIWLVVWRRRQPALLLRDAATLALAIVLATLPIAVATGLREGAPRVTTQLAALAWEFEGAEGMTIGNGPLLSRGIRPFTDPLGSFGRTLSDPLPVLGFFASAVPQRLSTLLFFPSPGFSDPLLIANPATHDNLFGQAIGFVRAVALVVGIAAGAAWWWRRREPDVLLIAGYALLYLAAFSFLFPPYHPFRYRIPIEPVRFMTEALGLLIVGRSLASAWASRRDVMVSRSPRDAPAAASASRG